MKQTIEIEVPDSKKAVWKDNKIVFEDIKPQLPKTWVEFCEQNPIKNGEYFIDTFGHFTKGECNRIRFTDVDRNTLPSRQAAEQHLALMQLHQLRDCYRQGWTPNWSNNLENKHCIVYINNMLRVCVYGTTQRFLSFQSYKIAKEFLNNFRDLIKQVGDLI